MFQGPEAGGGMAGERKSEWREVRLDACSPVPGSYVSYGMKSLKCQWQPSQKAVHRERTWCDLLFR